MGRLRGSAPAVPCWRSSLCGLLVRGGEAAGSLRFVPRGAGLVDDALSSGARRGRARWGARPRGSVSSEVLGQQHIRIVMLGS